MLSNLWYVIHLMIEYVRWKFNDEMNDMKKLVEFCTTNGKKFGNGLLDFENVDGDMLRYFFDLSMPSMSNYSYGSRILFNKFSKVVTEPEEALAYLVIENNYDRWVYQAEKQRRYDMGEMEQLINNDIPDVQYQKKVKKRKDNVDTAGKWTDEGLERFNELLEMVQHKRKQRMNFEQEMTDKYVENESNEDYSSKHNKRMIRESEETVRGKKKRVHAVNVLNVAEL